MIVYKIFCHNKMAIPAVESLGTLAENLPGIAYGAYRASQDIGGAFNSLNAMLVDSGDVDMQEVQSEPSSLQSKLKKQLEANMTTESPAKKMRDAIDNTPLIMGEGDHKIEGGGDNDVLMDKAQLWRIGL